MTISDEEKKVSLKKDFQFFIEHIDEFLKNPNYYGQFIAIKDKEVIGHSLNRDELIAKITAEGIHLGTFIVQHVIEGDGVVKRFYSRVN